jgi:hypothetical protein
VPPGAWVLDGYQMQGCQAASLAAPCAPVDLPQGRITPTTFTDRAVIAGQAYCYSVLAVGHQPPATALVRSDPSNRLCVLATGEPRTVPQQVMMSQPGLVASGAVMATADSEETAGEPGQAMRAIDGRRETIWHTEWKLKNPPNPHTLTLDLGQPLTLLGLRYVPRQDGSANGTILGYTLSWSLDGIAWSPPLTGAWATDTSPKDVWIPPVLARYVRLVSLTSVGNWASAAEVAPLTAP